MRNQYIGENCFKRQSWAVCRFKGNLAKNREGGGGGGGGLTTQSTVMSLIRSKQRFLPDY